MTGRDIACRITIDDVAEDWDVGRFEATEGLSFVTTASVTLVSYEPILSHQLLGRKAHLVVESGEDEAHTFHLDIVEAEVEAQQLDVFAIRLRLESDVGSLGLGLNTRIFQNATVPDILQEIFAKGGVAGVRWAIKQDAYPIRDYVVQRGESDLSFAERLLERDGIGFTIRDTKTAPEVVFFDISSELEPIPGEMTLWDRDSTTLAVDTVIDVGDASSVGPDAIAFRDFDFRRPSFPPRTVSVAAAKTPLHEVYFHPGGFVEPGGKSDVVSEREKKNADEPKRLANRRLESLRHGMRQIGGHSSCARLEAGRRFAVHGHARALVDDEYLITRMTHRGFIPGDETQAGAKGIVAYENQFEAIPKLVPWRPHVSALKPSTAGIEKS